MKDYTHLLPVSLDASGMIDLILETKAAIHIGPESPSECKTIPMNRFMWSQLPNRDFILVSPMDYTGPVPTRHTFAIQYRNQGRK